MRRQIHYGYVTKILRRGMMQWRNIKALDETCCVGEANDVMKKLIPFAAAMLALPLVACEQKAETVTAEAPDPQAAELAKAPPIPLPPSMKASVTFRCKDNSLVYVDFFSGDKQANVKTSEGGAPVKLTAEKAGDPLTADGYSMTGTPQAITLAMPGKPSQTCKK